MNLFPRRRSETLDGIEVNGHPDFLVRTQESLALLKRSSKFGMIENHLAVIRQGRRSGMKAWLEKPTFVVGKATWSHSVLWYAGAIAHDAYHSKLYQAAKHANGGNPPDASAWSGVVAEKKCLAFQREVLLELNVDARTIAYIESCQQNPTYQGRNQGWRSWLDYLKRWW
jgi:hypothetical protein